MMLMSVMEDWEQSEGSLRGGRRPVRSTWGEGRWVTGDSNSQFGLVELE